MKRIITLLLFVCFACNLSVHASNDTIRAPRPKVGIVLGGGGAKGAAHIGVLKHIEEIGIPVDYVVGTSMGSIIGGLYALGYSPDEMQTLISELDWSVYITNSIKRDNLSSLEKRRRSSYLFSIPFNTGGLGDKIGNEKSSNLSKALLSSLPESFMSGSTLLNLFNTLCVGYQDSMDFNNLPIPFACIATDLLTGDEVMLRSGKFAEAIRASMAIPGVFDPMIIGDKHLIDGGLVNNFPADRCREMGADIIIGIEVAQGLVQDPKDLKSLPQLLAQLKNIAVKGHNEENRQLCDVYIKPDVSNYGMLSFNAAAIDSIVKKGYDDSQAFTEQLKAIKNYIDHFQSSQKNLHAPKARHIGNDSIHIRFVNMRNVTSKEALWLMRKGHLQSGTTIHSKDIQEAIDTYRGVGSFSRIQYELKPVDLQDEANGISTYDLFIDFTPSEPHIADLGFRYDSEESASILFNLGLNQRKLSGFKANTSLCLGYNNRVNVTATYAGLSLANISIAYDFRMTRPSSWELDGTLINTNLVITNNIFYQNRFRIFISEFHLRNIQAAVGIESERISYFQTPYNSPFSKENIGPDTDDPYINSSFGPYTKLKYDNMNDAYFATSGLEASLEAHWRMDHQYKDLIGEPCPSNFGDIWFSIKGFLTQNKVSFIPQFYSRLILGENHLYAYHNNIGSDILGRNYDYHLPFIGVRHSADLLDFKDVYISRLDIRYNFYKKNYLTAMVNYARNSKDFTSVFKQYYSYGVLGAGLMYSYNSIIGPISLQLNWENYSKDPWSAYISIGYTF